MDEKNIDHTMQVPYSKTHGAPWLIDLLAAKTKHNIIKIAIKLTHVAQEVIISGMLI